jgi:hypothetical protein
MEPAKHHSWLCLGCQVFDTLAEVQMLFRCIHSPTQQTKEKRHQTGKSGESGKDFSE